MARVLVVDDNPDILDALDLLLSLHDYQVVTANDKYSAIAAVSRQRFDAVIQDMNFTHAETSGDEGVSLFHELRAMQPELPIVLITAWIHIENAVELVKAGAADYVQKPWDDQKLLASIEKICAVNNTANAQASNTKSALIYKSATMANLVAMAEKVADSDINVLITGANGAGKENLADHIHAHSPLSHAPMIKVNMGALPQELMEAELFGAERGAYTGASETRKGRFETADGGLLFLDEIGNLPLAGQIKLLRVLQTGEFERVGSSVTQKVNVRVISATNADLSLAVKRGEFREDLLYRLNVVELHLPALKERKEDILPLANHFLDNAFELSSAAKNYLLSHDWPGNVRELQNACKRAMVFAEGNMIDVADFNVNAEAKVLDEKARIQAALEKHEGVIKYAAEELGLSRQALYRRIEKYQLGD